jgi:hypothetical protein
MNIELLFWIIVGIAAFAIFFVNWILPQELVDPEDMSLYGRMLIKTIKEAGEKGVMVERNYYYSLGCFGGYGGHCYSRAVGVEFDPKSGWWIYYENQGNNWGLRYDHLWPDTTEEKIKICEDQNRKPSLFKVHEMIRE